MLPTQTCIDRSLSIFATYPAKENITNGPRRLRQRHEVFDLTLSRSTRASHCTR